MNARFVPPAVDLVFEAPYSNVSITTGDLNDHAIMRARQLSALLLAIQPPEGPDSLLWLAQQLSDELVVCVERKCLGGAA
jgi:hypothetical protein